MNRPLSRAIRELPLRVIGALGAQRYGGVAAKKRAGSAELVCNPSADGRPYFEERATKFEKHELCATCSPIIALTPAGTYALISIVVQEGQKSRLLQSRVDSR